MKVLISTGQCRELYSNGQFLCLRTVSVFLYLSKWRFVLIQRYGYFLVSEHGVNISFDIIFSDPTVVHRSLYKRKFKCSK